MGKRKLKLTPMEAHDAMQRIGDKVVVSPELTDRVRRGLAEHTAMPTADDLAVLDETNPPVPVCETRTILSILDSHDRHTDSCLRAVVARTADSAATFGSIQVLRRNGWIDVHDNGPVAPSVWTHPDHPGKYSLKGACRAELRSAR